MPYQFNPLTGNFDLINPQLTASEIKTLYEGEDNTNSFTDAEKSKLAGLNSANYVQLTGNQTIGGIKTFAEKLILPNCALVNGVADFRQATKPTQRAFLVDDIVVNEPLVIGDKWEKTDDGSRWFWNGTYWLSPPGYVTGNISAAYSATTNLDARGISGNLYIGSYFIHEFFYTNRSSGSLDEDNYWTVTVSRISNAGSTFSLYTSPDKIVGWTAATKILNLVVPFEAPAGSITTNFRFTYTKVGSPGNLNFPIAVLKMSNIYE